MITGPSSGIGLASALEMARRGYHVVAAGRSKERTMKVVHSIRDNGGSAEFIYLDLASLESCARAAREFARSGRSLDILINNAGVGGQRGLTRDGFEINFGVNHLGHFLLTNGLFGTFRPGMRIVVVSSEMHRRVNGIAFGELRDKSGLLDALPAYAASKLANILFARHLARLRPDLRTYSLHPGLADTNIFPPIARPFFRNKEPASEAARTSVWCATSDDVANQTGLYYTRMQIREPSAAAQDDDLARELWERSESWCGVTHRQ